MNRKREEELMQLAFGDLRREMGHVQGEISADPEAAKTYQAYCEMREGLKALRDVPEMQLSTERLRDAILKEGLQPKPASGWNWSWLATPIAVGACAFVVVTMMRKPATPFPGAENLAASNQTVVVEKPTAEVASNVSLDTKFEQVLKNIDPLKPVDFGTVELTESVQPVAKRGGYRSIRSNAPVATVAMMTKPVPGLSKSLSLSSNSPSLNDRKAETMSFASAPDGFDSVNAKMSFRSVAESAAAPNDIVQIESKMDIESGAAKATEVKGNQNVEIGG